ncbi:UNVERIFIED_CONTAM: hypothetical protein GTU68_031120 [Idotea baltica]|nr:hypothetical protein [Idotea baltica]
MAQIHALLLVNEKAISTDDVMENLQISRGNANMSLRELIAWNLVEKVCMPGERKILYKAKKDPWEIAKCIVVERRKRELQPLMSSLEDLSKNTTASKKEKKELDNFLKLTNGFLTLGNKSNDLLDFFLKVNQQSFFKPIIKFLKK